MFFGLTYDLIEDYLKMGYSKEEAAEFDKPETIDAIENELKRLGHRTERIGNIFELTKRLARGERWDFVFNIAEGSYGFGREAQVPALLDAYKIPYTFSGPLVLSLTLHKAFTKRFLRDFGINTPEFIMYEKESDLNNFNLEFPVFAKPVAEGTGKGIGKISRIENFEQLKFACTDLFKTFNQPVLVEEYLPGREFTCGIVGNRENARVVGVMEIIYKKTSSSDFYSFQVKNEYENMVEYIKCDGDLSFEISEMCLKIWRSLDALDGGRIDIKLDKNDKPSFIEINPLAGLNPVHSDLPILARLNGISYQTLMEEIINAAISRVNINE